MSEIDLIPASYRVRQRSLCFVRWFGVGVAGVLISSMVLHVLFNWRAGVAENEVRDLQLQRAISQQQRNQLEQLNKRREALQQQLDLLAGLRGGAAALQMLETIERAASPGKVWFTDWRFRRAGTQSNADPKTIESGYFIIIQNPSPAVDEAWVIETEMKIDGEALDHVALSQFVSRLVDQAEISGVSIVRTETVEQYHRPLVRFSLDVKVGT